MKYICTVGMIIFILASLVACRKTEHEEVKLAEFAAELMNAKELTVYKPLDTPGVSSMLKLSKDGSKIESIFGYKVLYQTKELSKIAEMFATWEMEDNAVPDKYTLDLSLETLIQIDDKYIIRYAQGLGESVNWYGMIGNKYYYLPEEFCRFIDLLK